MGSGSASGIAAVVRRGRLSDNSTGTFCFTRRSVSRSDSRPPGDDQTRA
jgi:hypothetical protein